MLQIGTLNSHFNLKLPCFISIVFNWGGGVLSGKCGGGDREGCVVLGVVVVVVVISVVVVGLWL